MQAMILAAGFGTRLKPYTDYKPKPLFPILNNPLLLLTIERLKNSGFEKIIVNCHHLKEQIVESVSTIPGVIVQQEETILGTGGGLRKALPVLSKEPLLIVNGDIYHTVPYRELYLLHIKNNKPVTMALHDLPRFNKVNVVNKNVVGFSGNEGESLAFTGIHVINPEILQQLAPDSFSCIIDLYKKLINEEERVGIYRADNYFWSDMGTPEDYLELHENLFNGSVPLYEEIENVQGNCISGNGTCCSKSNVKITDWACIGGNVKIGDNVHLKKSIVWNDVILKANAVYSETIVTGF